MAVPLKQDDLPDKPDSVSKPPSESSLLLEETDGSNDIVVKKEQKLFQESDDGPLIGVDWTAKNCLFFIILILLNYLIFFIYFYITRGIF